MVAVAMAAHLGVLGCDWPEHQQHVISHALPDDGFEQSAFHMRGRHRGHSLNEIEDAFLTYVFHQTFYHTWNMDTAVHQCVFSCAGSSCDSGQRICHKCHMNKAALLYVNEDVSSVYAAP